MSDVHNCDKVLQRVHDLLDGELTPERCQQLGEQLDGCWHCLEVFDFEAELKMAVSQTCQEHVPEDLMQRIRSALDAEA
ncbi:MAG: mycothiol system anti-sigma-R factor [Actinomycetota bacterium]